MCVAPDRSRERQLGCLDTAIAEAVTEHARMTAESRSTEEFERSGHIAHETRDLLNTVILAYQTLKRGTVAINGSTGAVLGRSLVGLRDLVDSTLSDIRIAANQQRRERVSVTPFLNDIAVAGGAPAERIYVMADPVRLGQCLSNLFTNAAKYTNLGGRIDVSLTREDDRAVVRVRDNGVGISSDLLPNVFDLGRQAPSWSGPRRRRPRPGADHCAAFG